MEIPALKLGKEHDVAVVIARHGRVEKHMARALLACRLAVADE